MSGVDFDDGNGGVNAASAKARRMRIIAVCVDRARRPASARPSTRVVEEISRSGGTPLVVAEGREVLGVIQLKDIVKGGIKERFAHSRKMGIRTVMITGDNPLTAAAIAAEAGVDDFMAQATPEDKLEAHPRRTGRRPPGRHDRRRHERRPGAGAGRRGRGDEHRHAGRHARPATWWTSTATRPS